MPLAPPRASPQPGGAGRLGGGAALEEAAERLLREEVRARVEEPIGPALDVVRGDLAEDHGVGPLAADGADDLREERLRELGGGVHAEAVHAEARPAAEDVDDEGARPGVVEVQQRLAPGALLVVAVARLEALREGVGVDLEPGEEGRGRAAVADVLPELERLFPRLKLAGAETVPPLSSAYAEPSKVPPR